jgi:hypothetical protein
MTPSNNFTTDLQPGVAWFETLPDPKYPDSWVLHVSSEPPGECQGSALKQALEWLDHSSRAILQTSLDICFILKLYGTTK